MVLLSFAQAIGICFLAALGYQNAYQFVYSTGESIDVQAANILENHLAKTYACANAKFANITGTGTSANKSYGEGAGSALDFVKAAGSNVIGTSLLQPLSIDQLMAYEEYWKPEEDASKLETVLFNITNEAINSCFFEEGSVVSFYCPFVHTVQLSRNAEISYNTCCWTFRKN